MKTAVIVTGGRIEKEFVSSFLKKTPYDYLIGVDHGIEFPRQENKIPTHIVGDFDSSCEETLNWFKEKKKIEIRRFLPRKRMRQTHRLQWVWRWNCDVTQFIFWEEAAQE